MMSEIQEIGENSGMAQVAGNAEQETILEN